jgi:hypothetical protein
MERKGQVYADGVKVGDYNDLAVSYDQQDFVSRHIIGELKLSIDTAAVARAHRRMLAARLAHHTKVFVGHDTDTGGFVYRDPKGMFLRVMRQAALKGGGRGAKVDVNVPCTEVFLPTKTAIAAARLAGSADPTLLLVFQDELKNRLHRYMNITL